MTPPGPPHSNPGKRESKSHGTAVEESGTGKPRNSKVVAVTSGKGGVGKTNVVANLSVSLSELGKRIVVVDADFGLASIDVLLGLTPRYHIGHVMFGEKTLDEVMIRGPEGIRIIPASSGLQRMSELTLAQRNRLVDGLQDLDAETDYFIIDTAAGISRNVIHFLLSAQEVIVVSAPEPTAIVDAYAVIKIVLAEDRNKPIHVLINSVEKAEEAHEVFCQINSVVKRFLNREIHYFGHIERDLHVPKAVRCQTAVTHSFPDAPASRCFRDLARRMVQMDNPAFQAEPLVWRKLLNDWIN